MSLTMTVPAAVPSLFHNSTPCVPSSAAKNSVPLTLVRERRDWNSPAPGLMSSTRMVPAGGAVALPQLEAVRAVVGREEQRAVDVGQKFGSALPAPGLMSLTRTVPAARAVALPQLEAVGAVVGGEEQRAVDIGQVVGTESPGPRRDVLDQDGAGRGAVGFPQLLAVDAVIDGENTPRRSSSARYRVAANALTMWCPPFPR